MANTDSASADSGESLVDAGNTPLLVDDKEDGIRLPEREYGYRITPFTWDELVQVIEVEQNLAKLSRSEEQQREYELFRRDLGQQWNSIYDYILHSKFNFEKRPISVIVNSYDSLSPNEASLSHMTPPAEHQRWKAHPSLESVNEIRKALLLNDFPYCMEPGIVHFILWKTLEKVTEEEIQEARTELKEGSQLVGGRSKVVDILHWKNPPQLQSLPGIDHVHFLCLLKKDGEY